MRNNLNLKNIFLGIILLLIFSCESDGPSIPTIPIIPNGGEAKVIGYLPTYRFAESPNIEYCKLTHLNLAFANPDASGNLIMDDISSDIIISISLAGGAISAETTQYWSDLIDIPANRPSFIAKIVDYVLTNDLDGVDVDLEWDLVTSGYSGFVLELNTALDAQQKLITAALPNGTRYSNASDVALAAYDFINIMSYDGTGPWRPQDVGPHSSYQFSQSGIDFWKNTVNIPGNKLTLGVPFYGYDFSTSPVSSVTYRQMVENNPDFADVDQIDQTYYNGRPTIEAKVALALQEVSGIMIWELGQDSFDEYSLLSTIHQKFTDLKVNTTGLCGN